MNERTMMKTLENPSYNPDALLDHVIEKLNLKNDAALARLLKVAPPVLSKIRHKRLSIGPAMLLRLHDVTDMPARELRALAKMSE